MSRYLTAFKENYNTIGLASAAAVSVAMLNPLPIVIGLVAEVAYLLIVPDTKWYHDRISRRTEAEAELARQKEKQQILPTLRPEVQARFHHLEEMRRQINAQDDKEWYGEVVTKLDYLLEKFLLFGAKEAQFQSYLARLRAELRSGDWDLNSRHDERPTRGSSRRGGYRPPDVPQRSLKIVDDNSYYQQSGEQDERWVRQAVEEIQAHYAEECGKIEATRETDQDEETQAVLTKRIDVLQRRSEFAGKIGKILGNINHQLQLVDDTFGLINDEIRARSPEQILADIDEVVVATNSMATTLEELAPYEQMVARTGS